MDMVSRVRSFGLSTFVVRLPLKAVFAETAERFGSPADSGEPALARYVRLCVLLHIVSQDLPGTRRNGC